MAITVYDINEKIRIGGVTSASTLAETITLLQTGKTYDCPKCEATGGFVPEGGTDPVLCDICQGFGKTALAYESYTSETGFRLVS